MKPALLLIDIQNDFLQRPEMSPAAPVFVRQTRNLLEQWRALGLPVLHIHTIVRPDGEDRMPHWRDQDIWACVEGTSGSRPPLELGPLPEEKIFRKQFYSAFENEEISRCLKDLAVDHLVIAGLYLHSCIRSTVLDAYARGYKVWVAEEATASIDSLHGIISRDFLAERAACFLPNLELLSKVAGRELIRGQAQGEILPAGVCGGKWIDGKSHETWAQHDPAEWEKVIAHVALATPEDFHVAIELARQAQVQWARTPSSCRLQMLKSWSSVLATHGGELAEAMAKELGKPITLAREEIQFAIGLLRATVEQNENQASQPNRSGGIWGRHCPRGIVGVVTPWNNPVAIPAGKIGPALFHGNAVIWKPALQAPRTTLLLSQTISEAGFPNGLVNVLFGGPTAVRNLIVRQEISFLSFTGSISAGREVATLCGSHGKTFQGELGGNNAAIIMPDVDLSGIARESAFSAFAYAGQRCTATRRFLVHVDRAREFQDALLASVQSMCLGHPMDEQTIIGPVISREKQKSLELVVQEGLAQGAQLIYGGKIPARWTSGCWFEPTLLAVPSANLTIVREETFGPVAVWQVIKNLKEGLQQLNSVSQGLTASLYSGDPGAWNLFREEAECGVLKLNQPTMGVDPGVPFGGWKASGIGPPEHGPGDVESYTRWQAVYTPLTRSI
jgi:acyl-CoA reductase-like NAD-dependent aldehyde dehydrogenase/nicotinamidase-related amidase